MLIILGANVRNAALRKIQPTTKNVKASVDRSNPSTTSVPTCVDIMPKTKTSLSNTMKSFLKPIRIISGSDFSRRKKRPLKKIRTDYEIGPGDNYKN
jgi:hypothetical protein